MIKLSKELKALVWEGADYIENGDPLKDVMGHADIYDLVIAVRNHLIEEGNKS